MLRILNMKDLDPNQADYCVCIMRSNRFLRKGIKHMPQLAPSWDLFNKYLAWQKAGEWNKDVFNSVYVHEFINGLCSKEARDALNWLWAQSYLSKEVQVGCTCPDESMCHRSIVGGILEGTGASVVYSTDACYKYYYDIWVATDRLKQGGSYIKKVCT